MADHKFKAISRKLLIEWSSLHDVDKTMRCRAINRITQSTYLLSLAIQTSDAVHRDTENICVRENNWQRQVKMSSAIRVFNMDINH